MLDVHVLNKARERDGDARGDRPVEVDEILEPQECVGYENELPLLDCEYDDYPEGNQLFRPTEGGTLRTLVNHDVVQSVKDMADELNTKEKQIEKAAKLHGIELPDGSSFDVEVSTDRLHALVGDIPEDMISSENPLLIATLYVEKGLSTEEVASVLSEGTDSNVRQQEVRQTLIDVGILEGLTSEDLEYQRRQNRGEINKPRYENGITIDATEL